MQRFSSLNFTDAMKHEAARLRQAAYDAGFDLVGVKLRKSGEHWTVCGSLFHDSNDYFWVEMVGSANTLGQAFEAAHSALPKACDAIRAEFADENSKHFNPEAFNA